MRNFVDRVEREGRAHIALVNKRETKTHLKKKEFVKYLFVSYMNVI